MFRFNRKVVAVGAAVALFNFGAVAHAQVECATQADVSAASSAYTAAYLDYSAKAEKANFFEFTPEYFRLTTPYYQRYDWCSRTTIYQDPNVGDIRDCQDQIMAEMYQAISEAETQLQAEAADAEMAMNAAWADYLDVVARPRCEAG